MVRRPLADIYYVECWKRFNFENTDHTDVQRDNGGSGMGLDLTFV